MNRKPSTVFPATIRLERATWQVVDDVAARAGLSRSEWIRRIIHLELGKELATYNTVRAGETK